MDYQEAIKEAEEQIDIYKSTALKRKKFDPQIDNRIIENKIEFFKTAISAMQEMQMYKENQLCLIPEDVYKRQCEELDEYKKLGTVGEFRVLIKQNTPDIPDNIECRDNVNGGIIYKVGLCPRCGERNTSISQYCRECGQAIDLGEENEY